MLGIQRHVPTTGRLKHHLAQSRQIYSPKIPYPWASFLSLLEFEIHRLLQCRVKHDNTLHSMIAIDFLLASFIHRRTNTGFIDCILSISPILCLFSISTRTAVFACRARQNQVLDSRRNKTVNVEPADPFLPQSVEIAMIVSRLLIIGLGLLWILALLLIGGAFGADAASVPVPGSANADPGPSTAEYRMSVLKEGLELHLRGEHAGAASTYSRLLEVSCAAGGDDRMVERCVPCMVASKVSTIVRSLRGGKLGFKFPFRAFFCTQVMPNDPDGLHLLGLSLYSQGMTLRGASERGGDSQGMQNRLMAEVFPTTASHRAHTTQFHERLGT